MGKQDVRPVVLVLAGTDGLPANGIERGGEMADVRLVTTEEQLRRELPQADALFIWGFKADLPGVWHLAKKVRWVHISAAGVNPLMFPAMREGDVEITNARGVFEVPMAEYALSMMLYFAKQLDRSVANQRERRWEFYLSDMLEGSSLVIVGMGAIGRTLALRARALGMRVIGVRRTGGTDDAADAVYPVERLREALAEGDYVVVVTPLTDRTRGLIRAEEFAAMKPGAVFVNLGRGGIVDEGAMLAALRDGRLRGVASDVFEKEPLPADSPLWDAPNLLISPHLGGDDVDSPRRLVEQWLDNLRRWTRGEPLLNRRDKEQGY
jgi:phosphoglycerate dehydrogenase-like enzyme